MTYCHCSVLGRSNRIFEVTVLAVNLFTWPLLLLIPSALLSFSERRKDRYLLDSDPNKSEYSDKLNYCSATRGLSIHLSLSNASPVLEGITNRAPRLRIQHLKLSRKEPPSLTSPIVLQEVLLCLNSAGKAMVLALRYNAVWPVLVFGPRPGTSSWIHLVPVPTKRNRVLISSPRFLLP
jgi:hypothetical protein